MTTSYYNDEWEADLAAMEEVDALLDLGEEAKFVDESEMAEFEGFFYEQEGNDDDDEEALLVLEELLASPGREYLSDADRFGDDEEDEEWPAEIAEITAQGGSGWGAPLSLLKRQHTAPPPPAWGVPHASLLKRQTTAPGSLESMALAAAAGSDASSSEEEEEEDAHWGAPGGSLMKRHRTPSEESVTMAEIRQLTGLGGRDVKEVLLKFSALVEGEDGDGTNPNAIPRDAFNFGFGQLMGSIDEDDQLLDGDRGERSAYVLARLYDIFDQDGSGVVDFLELGSALSVLCGGDSVERARAAFDLHDVNGDGVIALREMQTHLESVFKVAFAADLAVQVRARGLSPTTLAKISAEAAFAEADVDHNDVLTWSEFRSWFVANGDSAKAINNALIAARLIDDDLETSEADATRSFGVLTARAQRQRLRAASVESQEEREQRLRGTSATSIEEALDQARRAWDAEEIAHEREREGAAHARSRSPNPFLRAASPFSADEPPPIVASIAPTFSAAAAAFPSPTNRSRFRTGFGLGFDYFGRSLDNESSSGDEDDEEEVVHVGAALLRPSSFSADAEAFPSPGRRIAREGSFSVPRAEAALEALRSHRFQLQRIFEFLDEDGDGLVVVDQIPNDSDVITAEGARVCAFSLSLTLLPFAVFLLPSERSFDEVLFVHTPPLLPPAPRAGISYPAFGLECMFLELSEPALVDDEMQMCINSDQFELGMSYLSAKW